MRIDHCSQGKADCQCPGTESFSNLRVGVLMIVAGPIPAHTLFGWDYFSSFGKYNLTKSWLGCIAGKTDDTMNVVVFHRTEIAAVAALDPIVSHYKKLVVSQTPIGALFVFNVALEGVSESGQIRLAQSLIVDIDRASVKGHRFSGQADDAFDRTVATVVGDNHHVAAFRPGIRIFGLDNIVRSEGGIHAVTVNDGTGPNAMARKFDDRCHENKRKDYASATDIVYRSHLLNELHTKT
jgi:hypothetical protein